MIENAIECVGVSKRYLIGQHASGSQTLREAMAAVLRRDHPAREEIWPIRDLEREGSEA